MRSGFGATLLNSHGAAGSPDQHFGGSKPTPNAMGAENLHRQRHIGSRTQVRAPDLANAPQDSREHGSDPGAGLSMG